MTDSRPVVLTLGQAAEWLQTTPEALQRELEARRLRGFQVTGEWRVTDRALLDFMGELSVPGVPGGKGDEMRGRKQSRLSEADLRQVLSGNKWERAPAYTHNWPKKKAERDQTETYPEAYRAEVLLGERKVALLVGFTERECAGMKDRKRATVFLSNNKPWPLVEFAGANDYEHSGVLASVIKLPRQAGGGHPHLRPGMEIPAAYRVPGVDLCTYNAVVAGPSAAASTAIRVRRGQLDVLDLMAYHGLVRALLKEWL